MNIEMTIVEGRRQQQVTCNPVVSWRYKITTGPRCAGMVSAKEYKTVDGAYNAGLRMMSKFNGFLKGEG